MSIYRSVRFPLVLGLVCAVSGGMLGLIYSVTAQKIKESRKRKISAAFAALVPEYADFDEREGEEPGEVLYVVRDGAGAPVAYAARTPGEGSYNSMQPIELITVMDRDLSKVLGIRVVNSAETPGLGERINERPAPNSIIGGISGAASKKVVLLSSGMKSVRKVVGWTEAGVEVLSDDGETELLERAEVLDEELPPSFQAQFSHVKPRDLSFRKDGGELDAISGATVSSTAVLNGVRRGVEAIRTAFGGSKPQ